MDLNFNLSPASKVMVIGDLENALKEVGKYSEELKNEVMAANILVLKNGQTKKKKQHNRNLTEKMEEIKGNCRYYEQIS